MFPNTPPTTPLEVGGFAPGHAEPSRWTVIGGRYRIKKAKSQRPILAKEWQLNKLPSNLVPKLEFGHEIVEVI